jgi:hypothetical protein
MIKPVLNLNGGSAADLIQPRINAMDHLMNAIDALRQVTPHGRDYPADQERCTNDRDLHFIRLEAIKTLHAELMAEALYIKEQAA